MHSINIQVGLDPSVLTTCTFSFSTSLPSFFMTKSRMHQRPFGGWHLVFESVLLEGTYPLSPPPLNPSQLLAWSYRWALSQLQAHHHSVCWTNDTTCPSCNKTKRTVARLFSCPTHATDLALWDMWAVSLQEAQFLAGLRQFVYLQIDFDSFPTLALSS